MSGKKSDENKIPVVRGLLHYFPRALEEVARASVVGHKKYGVAYEEKNWSKLEGGEGRYLDAAGRHLLKIAEEGDFDKETQELLGMDVYHAAQVAWDILAYLELKIDSKEVV